MKDIYRNKLLILVILQVFVIISSFVLYHSLTLLSYINISFYLSSALLLSGLLIHTIHSGFFDVISRSFTLAFSRAHHKKRFDEVPALSDLISINQKPLYFYGLTVGFFMVIALIVFYI